MLEIIKTSTFGAYTTVKISNAAAHSASFSQWRTSEKDDSVLEIMQIRKCEMPLVQKIIDQINNPSQKKTYNGNRYIELLSVAENKNLKHGSSWICSWTDLERKGLHPSFEREVICYVYEN